MNCKFTGHNRGDKCEACGYVLLRTYKSMPHRMCHSGNGLGDILERELTRMGITQSRYKEIKERFGLPPTCNCEKRKQWLNKVGRYIGI
jgi:hypothetical protein